MKTGKEGKVIRGNADKTILDKSCKELKESRYVQGFLDSLTSSKGKLKMPQQSNLSIKHPKDKRTKNDHQKAFTEHFSNTFQSNPPSNNLEEEHQYTKIP